MIPVCSDELVAHFCGVNAVGNSSHGAWPHSIYNHTHQVRLGDLDWMIHAPLSDWELCLNLDSGHPVAGGHLVSLVVPKTL